MSALDFRPRTRPSGRNAGGMTMVAPASQRAAARCGSEDERVRSAERAGGPWWSGPTWLRVTPGVYGGEEGQLDIYDGQSGPHQDGK